MYSISNLVDVNFSPGIVMHHNTVQFCVQSLAFLELHSHKQYLLSSMHVLISVEDD